MLSFSAFGQVVVFDRYHSTYALEGDHLTVHKKLRLKNIGTNPIIPGEIHFKLSQQEGDIMYPVVISNLNIKDHYDKPLDFSQFRGDSDLDVIFTIWEPLLPDFYYDFQMEYELEFDPKGILFYEIRIPTEKTTIDIKNKETEFFLPKRYHVTYAPEAEVEALDGARVIKWASSADALSFEYSVLPLPSLGVRMVNVFWIFLISISLLYLFYRFRKARKSSTY